MSIIHLKSHKCKSFQNLDLLYDLHADFVFHSLGANARFVAFHVDEVDRPVCCARQANDIAE
jgi:hypothetical protein